MEVGDDVCTTQQCSDLLTAKQAYLGTLYDNSYGCIPCAEGCADCAWNYETNIQECFKCNDDAEVSEEPKMCDQESCEEAFTLLASPTMHDYCIPCPPGCKGCYIEDNTFVCTECYEEAFVPLLTTCSLTLKSEDEYKCPNQ